jgi:hypothetical protein
MSHFRMDKESYLKLLIKSTAGNVHVNVTLQNGQESYLKLLIKSTAGKIYVNVTLQDTWNY